ncbi:MAG: ATP-binding protein [Candidatus Woesearchaeota archaeon]|nr:ATP-binding protein [Candidatus Woesearchaeota archaeon]
MPEIVVGRDDDDMKKYGTKGTLFIGKHLVGSGEDAHMTTPVLMDALRPHIILISGKRGQGKSYTMGVLIEELAKIEENIRKNLCSVVIDTQGIFWTMKSPSEKDALELKEWGMNPQGFDADVFVPEGQAKIFSDAGVDFDLTFSIAPYELTADDWLSVFEIRENDSLGILIRLVFEKLPKKYGIKEIIEEINKKEYDEKEKLALKNRFIAASEWGIFGESRMPEMLKPGKITIIDISLTSQNVRALLVSIICRKLLEERIKARRSEELADIEMEQIRRVPMPWVFIDEAHNFLPNEGITPATEILGKIVKEGRQPGITLVFATQRPEKLHSDAVAQADMVISHRLTARADIDALKAVMQTYMLYDIGKYISELPHLMGTAIILDDNSERLYKVRTRPRQSWHAGSSPVAFG